ncbi:MAG: class I SAM-dependent methyltransferase [Phycisphaerales bacterium]
MSGSAPTPRVGVIAVSSAHGARAHELSEQTGGAVLTAREFEQGELAGAIIVDDAGLALAPSPREMPHVAPMRIDISDWETLARRPVSLKQPLAKAVGVQSRASAPEVLDCTAGLLSDAFHLALMGCHVTALERSPVVHALAEDALQRAAASPTLSAIVARINLHRASAVDTLASIEPAALPAVIYVDPMHPPRDRHASALVRKEMRILRLVVGDDLDAPDLVRLALERLTDPRARVVLKLPLRAEPLPGLAIPAHVHEAKTVRYEVHKPVHALTPSNR